MTEIIWHKHHIIPKHAGGSNDKSNLLKCNIAMHAFMHEQRYIEIGDEYDRIAALCLKKQITGQEARRLVQLERLKRYIPWNKGKTDVYSAETKKQMGAKNKGRTGWNKGKTGVYSDETIEKIRVAAKNRKPPSNETREKLRAVSKGNTNVRGRKWYHNPELGINKLLKQEQIPEYEALGYIPGRILKS